jgi:protease-4
VWRAIRRLIAVGWIHCSEWALARLGRRKPYGVLTLELGGDLAEEGGEQRLLGLLRRPTADYLDFITLLRWARDDAGLAGVLIRCDDLRSSWARLQGLRRSLERLRAAGKKVWVHLERAGVREYYLASAAEQVSLAPAATLDVTGLSSEAVFLLDALQKLGVQADVVQMGRYKSAGEMFTRRDMSVSQHEMLESLVDDLYEQVVVAVSASRRLEPPAVRDLLGRGPFVPAEARAAGLVDAIAYADEIEHRLRDACGGAPVIDRAAYTARRGRAMRLEVLRRSRATFALLYVGGTIKPGDSIPGPPGAHATGSATVAAALAQVRKRADIGALIVRIASPGGSVLGSDLIWREMMRAREAKPVVVSCGDVAASGGYYVALAGAPVLAEAGTITGSIGVIAGKASLRGLYDRLGVSKQLISRGRNAALHSDYEPLDEEGRARIHAQADAFYRDFVAKVAAARGLTDEAAAAAAQGRVWTGRQALERGLIDELGGIEEAFAAAKRAVGIAAADPVTVERFPRPRRLWKVSVDLNLPNGGALAEVLPALAILPSLRFLLRERVWALLPFQLRFF